MATVFSTLTAPFIKLANLFRVQQVQPIAGSSGWFVCNTDTKTADSDIDDPSEAALGAQTKAKVFDTTGKSYIDVFHLFVGTTPTAAVDVVAFGFWRWANGVGEGVDGALEPYQVSTSFPSLTATAVSGGFWAPLYAPEAGGDHSQALSGAAPEVICNASSPNYKVSGKASWATCGCERAVVLVATASTTPDVGLLLARTGN